MIKSVENILNRIEQIRQRINFYYSFSHRQREDSSSFKDILDEVEEKEGIKNLRSRAQRETPYLTELIEKYAKMNNLDPDLIRALIKVESNFNPMAISRAGAKGLMQLMPETANKLGVDNIFDPEENIAGGTRYLRQMLDQFGNDLPMALAAYNAGPNRVEKSGGIPKISETQNYIKKVLSLYRGT